jgi:hypothetical protein
MQTLAAWTKHLVQQCWNAVPAMSPFRLCQIMVFVQVSVATLMTATVAAQRKPLALTMYQILGHVQTPQ